MLDVKIFHCLHDLMLMDCIFGPKLSFRIVQVTYLEPGQSSSIEAGNGSKIQIQATAGPVLGPPWQRPENGYFFFVP